MKLIVGLGNPGSEYEHTRHNVGFDVLDNYLKNKNLEAKSQKFGGKYCEEIINGEKVIYLKPQEYINLSGDVIKRFADFFKIDVSDILIISDDLDLPCGKIKIKLSGGSGGHNGLKNIERNFGTQEYKRIKIGIANNKEIDTKDYVLGKFSGLDGEKIKEAIDVTNHILNDFFILKFDNLMNKYN